MSDVLKRSQRLYARQLEGKTTRQLVLEHASIEGISETTAWDDWNRVKVWNNEDWEKDRETLLPRLQAMRVRLFNKAVKKGQLQTAAQILDSLGKVIGESVETVNIQAPELSIRVIKDLECWLQEEGLENRIFLVLNCSEELLTTWRSLFLLCSYLSDGKDIAWKELKRLTPKDMDSK